LEYENQKFEVNFKLFSIASNLASTGWLSILLLILLNDLFNWLIASISSFDWFVDFSFISNPAGFYISGV
jgi:hypothetical protein